MALGEACHFLDLNLCKAGVELDPWTRQFFEILLLSDTLQRDFFCNYRWEKSFTTSPSRKFKACIERKGPKKFC